MIVVNLLRAFEPSRNATLVAHDQTVSNRGETAPRHPHFKDNQNQQTYYSGNVIGDSRRKKTTRF